MFSLPQIAVCAFAGGIASALVLLTYWRHSADRGAGRAAILGVAAAASIALWRAAANTAALNDDLIPLVSPNDVLSPVVTHVSVAAVASFTGARERADWPRAHALITVVTLIVNVVTI